MESPLTSELLQCAICLGELEDAFALPCLHSFCSQCLQGHISVSQKKVSKTLKLKRFPCPTCRVWINSPGSGVLDFTKDFRVVKLKDALKEWKKKGSSEKILTCGLCEKDFSNPLDHYCADCQKYLCSMCCTYHNSHSVLSNHIMFPVPSGQGENESIKCSVHLDEQMKYHCETCSLGICVKCIMDEHGNHKVINYQYGNNPQKVEMRNSMSQLQTQLSLLNEVMFNLTSIEGHIRSQHEQTKLQIRKHSNKMINHVYQEQGRLLKETDVDYQQKYDDLSRRKENCKGFIHHLTNLQSKLESLLRVPDINTVLDNFQSLLKDTQDTETVEIYTQELVDIPKCAQYMSSNVGKLGHIIYGDQTTFKPTCTDLHKRHGHSDEISGRIYEYRVKGRQDMKLFHGRTSPIANHPVDHKPSYPVAKLLCHIGGKGTKQYQLSLPYGITFSADEKLVVAENGNGRIQMYTKEGVFLKMVPLPRCCPRSLSLLKNQKVVFTDENEKCLKIINLETFEISSITNRYTERTVSFPFGVASLCDGRFVISDMIYETVTLTSSTGVIEKQLGEEDPSNVYDNPSYLATDSEDNIFVSDSGNHKIKVYNKYGMFLFQFGNDGVKEGQLRYPKGIAVDNNGLIYVADAGNDRVVVFSRLGFFLSVLVDRKYGIERPTGLAYSPTGLLAVSMPDKHEIFVYQLDNSIPSQF